MWLQMIYIMCIIMLQIMFCITHDKLIKYVHDISFILINLSLLYINIFNSDPIFFCTTPITITDYQIRNISRTEIVSNNLRKQKLLKESSI